MDHLIRGVGRNATVRVAAVTSTGVAAEAVLRHHLSPSAACAVGRALTSGLLLATLTKGGERVTVQLVGNGPIGSITVDASVEDVWGKVRGYAARPHAGPPHGRLPVAETLGRRGVVNVLRDLG